MLTLPADIFRSFVSARGSKIRKWVKNSPILGEGPDRA